MGAEPWNVGDNGADAKLIQALVTELRTAAVRLDAATEKLDRNCVEAEDTRSRILVLETQRDDSKEGQATNIALVAVLISLGAVLVQVLMSVK